MINKRSTFENYMWIIDGFKKKSIELNISPAALSNAQTVLNASRLENIMPDDLSPSKDEDGILFIFFNTKVLYVSCRNDGSIIFGHDGDETWISERGLGCIRQNLSRGF